MNLDVDENLPDFNEYCSLILTKLFGRKVESMNKSER